MSKDERVIKYVNIYGEQHRFLIIDAICFVIQQNWYNPETFDMDEYIEKVISHQEGKTDG